MKFGTRTIRGRVVYDRKTHAFSIADVRRIAKTLSEYDRGELSTLQVMQVLEILYEGVRLLARGHDVYSEEWRIWHDGRAGVFDWLVNWAAELQQSREITPPSTLWPFWPAVELVIPGHEPR